YKEKGVNPFSGVLVLIIQLPIIWALYQMFLHAGFPEVNSTILYPFISSPENINVVFLNQLNITEKSSALAFLAAVSTFIQLKIATSYQRLPAADSMSFSDTLARSMQMQMKYVFPVI